MKFFSVFLLGCLLACFGNAQTIRGTLHDQQTGEPVPFANIGIPGMNLGTASDAEGRFLLDVGKASDSDLFRVTCIGYEPAAFDVAAIRHLAKAKGVVLINLKPKTYILREVTVKPVKTKMFTLGNPCTIESAYGNAFYSKELGTEIGVVMELPRRRHKAWLKSFRFVVGKFTYGESFPVRMNIYSFEEGKPGANLLREPVFLEITREGEYLVNLEPCNLVVTGDFLVSLEYYCVMDQSQGDLIFCAVHQPKPAKSNGFFRWVSQGNWQREPVDNLGFSVVAECAK
jgi:hypothetical protein